MLWALRFIFKHGSAYVQWPKLIPPSFLDFSDESELGGTKGDKARYGMTKDAIKLDELETGKNLASFDKKGK